MKINVEFDSIKEMEDFCSRISATPMAQLKASFEIGDKVVEEATKEAKEEKAKKSTPKKENVKEEPKEEAQEVAEEPAKEEEAQEAAADNEHTDAELKLLLSGKLKKGKKAEVKALFEKYGVGCLTDLIAKEKDNIDAVYAEAEVL